MIHYRGLCKVPLAQARGTERKSTENAADHSDTSERMQSNHRDAISHLLAKSKSLVVQTAAKTVGDTDSLTDCWWM